MEAWCPAFRHKYCRSEKKKLMEKEKSGNFAVLRVKFRYVWSKLRDLMHPDEE